MRGNWTPFWILAGGIFAITLAFQNCAEPLPDLTSQASVMSENALTYLYLSPNGRRVLNGGGCPVGTVSAGTVADAGSVPPGGTPSGNQIFCFASEPPAAGMSVITNVWFTAPAPTPPGCPPGYLSIGSVTTCELAVCDNNQNRNVCVESKPYVVGTPAVREFYISPHEGAHIPDASLACRAGDTAVGITTDCGGGVCGGHQLFCVNKQ